MKRWRNFEKMKGMNMITKENVHLDQRVWFGAERREAIVDGIMRTGLGLMMVDGGYVIARWEDVYGEA